MKYVSVLAATGVILGGAMSASADITLNEVDFGVFGNPASPITANYPGGYKFTNAGQNSHQVRATNTATAPTIGPPREQDRNYDTYDLSDLAGTITAATLRVYVDAANTTTGAPYQSSDAMETVNLFDVSTPSSVLTNPASDTTAAGAAFADLGSGNAYGSFVVHSTDAGIYIDVPLNAQAIADLSVAVGVGRWSVGGALVYNGSYGANSTFISERVLMNNTATTNDPPWQLVLTGTVAPQPARCNAADVAGLGGSPGHDGQNTVDDLVYFLSQFFAGNIAVADIAGLGGSNGADGQLTPDDLVAFLAAFFAPCDL